MDDAAERLSELVLAVDQTGKAGSITIKISLRKATAGALAVAGKIEVKKPMEPPIEALMFPTPEGNLLTEDPRQQKLELKTVASGAKDLKTVSA
jgi:hypothetical protein